VRRDLPPLPAARRQALVEAAGADRADADLLVRRELDGVVLDAVAGGADAGLVVTRAVNDLPDGPGQLDGAAMARVVGMEQAGELTATQAKDVLAVMASEGGDPDAVAAAKGYEAMDSGELESLVSAAIAENPDAWEKFCAGEDKVQGVFVGAVMKATRGQADGKAVSAILRARRG